ncbi:1-O-acylceramide synthase precursor, putative [Entamoeba invadens IP1]|uniref:1-O-acylceramide synthase, putative n=1 Tax=Entamoeba invadens IP1 TaxID=370355 RepID=A0A0A1U4Q4_ENTIV|nr:1-O-acylceramide synthase precursor, putative [Entamoeba invadens IP1]ELP89232.1 1-O-acylceramide synthase precursor, putative [Entamoeba invadens IP1]|eukprot:XP_004256003.1 1-O-acylceramide synthase precursor, putative [Entamoeba invadens IP1]
MVYFSKYRQGCVVDNNYRFVIDVLGFQLYQFNTENELGQALQIRQCSNRHPVFFVPGILASTLHMKGTIPKTVPLPRNCPRIVDERLWASFSQLFPTSRFQCFVAYVSPVWDNTKMMFETVEGLEVYYKNFPSTKGISTLGSSVNLPFKLLLKFFGYIVDKLRHAGWQDDVDMFGLGYDWRFGDVNRDDYASKIKEMIIRSHEQSGHKVVFVSHSMGGLVTLQLFKFFGLAFCREHIEKLITISTPIKGAPKSLRAILSGDTQHLPMSSRLFRTFERRMPSLFMMLPKGFYEERVLVQTPNKEYKGSDLKELLNSIDEMKEWSQIVFEETEKRLEFGNTGRWVPWDCLYSSGIPTEDSYNYPNGFDREPIITMTAGDGTVPLDSMTKCSHLGAQKEINMGRFSHKSILKTQRVRTYVYDEACKDNI